ncbi:MAG: C40 family peptidase [Bacteroidales bacterium]|nr:C40 family peptidase [Bacteroidales bacterium]
MMNFQRICYIFLFVLLITGACSTRINRTRIAGINFLLDSLKSVYAPDERIALWNVSVSGSSAIISLTGEVDKKEAYNGIVEVFEEKYPDLENSIVLLPEGESRQIVSGLINNSVANLRSGPRHSAEIVTQVLLGTPIRVLKRENDWYLVQTPNQYLGWVDAPALERVDGSELTDFKRSEKIVYNEQYGFSYAEPNDNSQPVSDLVIGCILPVTSSVPGFYEVQYPDSRVAWVKKVEVISTGEVFNITMDEKDLVETARKFMGIPFLWGGTSSKAIDCSGFTSTVYFMNGILLQRDASQQTRYGKEITTSYESKNLVPGDLLFFGRRASDSLPERVTHVAMYIGDTEFIHASGKVRINSIDSARNNFLPEYVPRFVRAVRIKGEAGGKGIERISENEFYKEIISSSE